MNELQRCTDQSGCPINSYFDTYTSRLYQIASIEAAIDSMQSARGSNQDPDEILTFQSEIDNLREELNNLVFQIHLTRCDLCQLVAYSI